MAIAKRKESPPDSEEKLLTLSDGFKEFWVSDDLALPDLWHAIGFLRFSPKVGASVYAGYVENGYAL